MTIRCGFGVALILGLSACSSALRPTWNRAPVVSSQGARPVAPIESRESADDYVAVPQRAAQLLGCTVQTSDAVCQVALPTAEEDSAFHAEGMRLIGHGDPRCRNLGEAILQHVSSVRMYRKALIRYSGPLRLYGVGHTYEIDDTWLVRVARRLDDLNVRTLDEKKRTLRHEMSHTIGVTETRGNGWSAEDYADACA